MQQTFVFSNGKVVLENGIMYIRKTKPALTVSEALHAILPFTFAARFVLYLFQDESPKRNSGLVLFGFMFVIYLLLNFVTYYNFLFKRSFANRIPIQNIQSSRLEEDTNQLEVHLFLRLTSGRERKISFRKLEKQYEELTIALAQSLPITKLAC